MLTSAKALGMAATFWLQQNKDLKNTAIKTKGQLLYSLTYFMPPQSQVENVCHILNLKNTRKQKNCSKTILKNIDKDGEKFQQMSRIDKYNICIEDFRHLLKQMVFIENINNSHSN